MLSIIVRFNTRNLLEGESVEQYVMSLHNLTQNREYGAPQDKLFRYRIVIGIRDKGMCLQLDADLRKS